MQTRKASIKETGEELSPDQWERFDAAVAELKAERRSSDPAEPPEERRPVTRKAAQATLPV